MRILVASPAPADCQGGAEWAVLQYVLGFRRLGHEVELTRDRGGKFDLVLNISGTLAPELLAGIPLRVYLDLDPAFNQLWHANGIDRRFDGHTHHITVGQAIGTPNCEVPTCGLHWIKSFPPVVLDRWPSANNLATTALTTVANFRSYGSIEHDGRTYGQKVHSLRKLRHLPERTRERFVLAMTVHEDERGDLEALHRHGWELVDPRQVAGTPSSYRNFVSGSWAEIGIAKHGYVASRCGWFSDRSACYLASGRPVVAQNTGFSDFLPIGKGLLAFDDEDGAVAAIEEIRRDYSKHAEAARQVAEEHFDSDRVLTRILAEVDT